MSRAEIADQARGILWRFVGMMAFIGVILVFTIVVYIKKSGKIVTEVIEESEAARHYQQRLIEAQGAIKELHNIIDSTSEEVVVSKKKLDSIEKVSVTQDKKIKSLQYENKVLRDSVGRDRVKVFDLHGPGNH